VEKLHDAAKREKQKDSTNKQQLLPTVIPPFAWILLNVVVRKACNACARC
jgi:hypothetical protein